MCSRLYTHGDTCHVVGKGNPDFHAHDKVIHVSHKVKIAMAGETESFLSFHVFHSSYMR